MISIGKGIVAGVVASALLYGALFLLSFVNAVPSPDPVRMLSGIRLWPLALSWIVQFALGGFVWGALFAIVSPILPGPYWLRGAIFGVIVWLSTLGLAWIEPTAGMRFEVAAVLLNLAFGTVLGATYGSLLDQRDMASRRRV